MKFCWAKDMAERIKQSLEEIIATSVGGPCAFPEEIVVPVDRNQMKLEKNGKNGDKRDDLRFERDILQMVEDHVITEEEAKNLLAALKN